MPSFSASVRSPAIPDNEVRAALVRVCSCASFQHSPQLQRFLTFLVEESLAGRAERLKEYVIGVEVFGRPATYDPRLDSLVRVEARRLRTALDSYYRNEGFRDAVNIELPKGSYQPVIRESLRAVERHVLPNANVAVENEPEAARYATGVIEMLGTKPRKRLRVTSVALGTLVISLIVFLSYRPRPHALNERDAILLTDFSNSTGEAVFDHTLKQGLTMELEQSPFINLVSERRVLQTRKLMGKSESEVLGEPVLREVCVRAGAKAMISGSISRIGDRYVMGLTATNCGTGDSFAHVQVQADGKEHVLKALNEAGKQLRDKLGESSVSLQKFDLPLEEATTSSLDALQAFTLGQRTAREKGSPADIPFYRRAIELDPDFAAAYAVLGVSYVNQNEPTKGAECLKKAYELRERVSERERFRISAFYYTAATGEADKSVENYDLWRKTYSRDFAPYINLGLIYVWLGQYEKAAAETEAALQLDPNNVLAYSNLAADYIKLGRFDDAGSIFQQAAARNLNSKFMRENRYLLAFARNDSSAMRQQIIEAAGNATDEAPLLYRQSDTEAYFGHLTQSREYSRRAVEEAIRIGANEAAANWLVNEAIREVEFGNKRRAKEQVDEALKLSPGRDVVAMAALGMARAGETRRAASLLRDLQKAHPLNTMINVYWAPTINAAIEIENRNAQKALQILQQVEPYELGSPPPTGLGTLYPVYLRGEAYLLLHNGKAAVAEYQKIVSHSSLVLNFPLGALASLQLARAQVAAQEGTNARKTYGIFFELWKGADRDIPVLQRARAEYARIE